MTLLLIELQFFIHLKKWFNFHDHEVELDGLINNIEVAIKLLQILANLSIQQIVLNVFLERLKLLNIMCYVYSLCKTY